MMFFKEKYFLPGSFVKVHSACVCHQGNVREKNEDNYYYNYSYLPEKHGTVTHIPEWNFTTRRPHVMGVFDGMGGENAGELASYTAAIAFDERIQPVTMDKEEIIRILNEVSGCVYRRGQEEKYRLIGATVTLFFMEGKRGCVVDLGDSPMFLLRDGVMSRISREHTDAEILKEHSIKRKPALTQFLGINTSEMMLEPYIGELELLPGDVYLISSDGLTDMVDIGEIEKLLCLEGTPKQKTEALLCRALENGGKDNTTIMVCEIN